MLRKSMNVFAFMSTLLISIASFSENVFRNYEHIRTYEDARTVQKSVAAKMPSVYQIHGIGNSSNALEVFDAMGDRYARYMLPAVDEVLQSVCLSNDDSLLACGGGQYGACVGLYNTTTHERITTFADTIFYDGLLFSSDSKYLAMKEYNRTPGWPIRVFNVETKQELPRLQGNPKASWTSLTITSVSKEKILAAGSNDWTIWLWRDFDASKVKQLKGHNSSVNSVSFSPDDKYLASGSADGTLKIWDVATGACLKTIDADLENGNGAVAWSPDGKYIAFGTRWLGKVKIFDVNSGVLQQEFSSDWGNKVEDIKFSADGNTIVTQYSVDFVEVWQRSPAKT